MASRKLPSIDVGDPGIDPGIRDVVDFLRSEGLDTYTSCEGEDAHLRRGSKPGAGSSYLPYVTVLPLEGETLERTRVRLARCLLRAGYRDFSTHIDECHGFTRRDAWAWPDQVRVEFYHDSPVKPYVRRKGKASTKRQKPTKKVKRVG